MELVWNGKTRAQWEVRFAGDLDQLHRIDLTFRVLGLFHWRLASENTGILTDYINPALFLKKIVNDDMETELALIEAEDTLLREEHEFEEDLVNDVEDMRVGGKMIAVVKKLNRDNSITGVQLGTIMSNPAVREIMELFRVGSLTAAEFKLNELDLTGLEPFDDSYKVRIQRMLATYRGE